MRLLNPSFAVASLVGFLTAASCTLITDVDRTKIPTDAGPSGGTAGSAGETGGMGAESGAGAEGGTGARGGRGGSAGTGGTSAGTSGTSAGTSGDEAGTGGTGGSSTPTETCDEATGRITIGVGTLITTGWTFALGDGVNSKVTFTFDWDDDTTDEPGDNVIHFSGAPSPAQLAGLITDAINGASNLEITATTTAAGGSGGAGGESGAGASGAGAGGQSGEASPPAPMTETVELTNDLAGARGNVTITETVGNPNFKVSGMSGGKAVICSSAASCSDNDECDSDRSCSTAHVCD